MTVDSTVVVDVLRRHAQHSSAALALNRDTAHFTSPGIDGVIAYRLAGRRDAVQIGSVFAAPADQPRLLAAFHRWAVDQGRRVSAVQLHATDLALYHQLGYEFAQLGASFSIELARFGLGGRRFEKVRNKIARARRAGVEVVEAGDEVPHDEGLATALDGLDERWLAGKGRLVRQLEFMVGERDRSGATVRRLFVARLAGEPIGYISYAPVFGAMGGWLCDLTRRVPEAPPGASELIFVEALRRFAVEGSAWLHLGLTPFCQLSADHRPPVGANRRLERFTHLIADRGAWVYPGRTQSEYKTKWQPTVVCPEYVGFYPAVSMGAVWRLLRLTRAI